MSMRKRPIVIDDLPTTPDGMRSVASRMICPLCGRGPYRALAMHVSHAHDVNSKEFSDLLEVTFKTHYVDEDLRENWRQQAKDSGNSARLQEADRGKITTWSKAGIRARIETGRANGMARTPEQLEHMRSTANSREARERAARTYHKNLPDPPHGTSARYRRLGCRCDICWAWKRGTAKKDGMT